jgi:hypothetical protein
MAQIPAMLREVRDFLIRGYVWVGIHALSSLLTEKMRESWALAGVAIITLMASMGTLVPLFAELSGSPIAGWKIGRRVFVATLLLITSSFAGFAAYKAALSATDTAHATGTTTSSSATTLTQTVGTDRTIVVLDTLSPTPRPPQIAIRDDHGRNVPQLVRVAQRLPSKGYATEAELREETEKSAEFGDMITVHMTLDVTVRGPDGTITASFVVISRGGGFRWDAAHTQALERLAAAFKERLDQEVP